MAYTLRVTIELVGPSSVAQTDDPKSLLTLTQSADFATMAEADFALARILMARNDAMIMPIRRKSDPE